MTARNSVTSNETTSRNHPRTTALTDSTVPTPPTSDAPSPPDSAAANAPSALEASMLRVVAEAAKLRLENADLRAEIAALKAAHDSPTHGRRRSARAGASRSGLDAGVLRYMRSADPGWAETLDSTITLASFVKAPTFLYRCNVCVVKHMATADAEKAAEALAERRRERVDLLRAAWASMPVGDRDLSMTTVATAKAFDGAYRVADPSKVDLVRSIELGPAPKKRVLLLRGVTGVGKTTLADALAQDVIRAGESLDAAPHVVKRAASVRHMTAAALAGARKRAPLGREAPLVEEAMRASVLVLDELGARR